MICFFFFLAHRARSDMFFFFFGLLQSFGSGPHPSFLFFYWAFGPSSEKKENLKLKFFICLGNGTLVLSKVPQPKKNAG